ncbi:MAG: PaaI family thioesterase [Crocinitomicaceae bacterium]|nr:PaaI family thioesterase [Crocinitomicaceae bacterium]
MNHFERLTRLYQKAPIHDFYKNISIEISDQSCTISLPVNSSFFHGGMAVHGSVYFKLLEDAAYFACQSQVTDFFILTTNFTISLTRPVTKGILTAKGSFVSFDGVVFKGTAILTDSNGKLCGRGEGEFRKSKTSLSEIADYSAELI